MVEKWLLLFMKSGKVAVLALIGKQYFSNRLARPTPQKK
jgi:hypothetical protein